MDGKQILCQIAEALDCLRHGCHGLSLTAWAPHTEELLNFTHRVTLKSTLHTDSWVYFLEVCLCILHWKENEGCNMKVFIQGRQLDNNSISWTHIKLIILVWYHRIQIKLHFALVLSHHNSGAIDTMSSNSYKRQDASWDQNTILS